MSPTEDSFLGVVIEISRDGVALFPHLLPYRIKVYLRNLFYFTNVAVAAFLVVDRVQNVQW